MSLGHLAAIAVVAKDGDDPPQCDWIVHLGLLLPAVPGQPEVQP